MDKLTREQGAVVGAFTGILAGSFSDMHEYIEKILDRPVFTHELASHALADEIKEMAKDDFLSIVAIKEDEAREGSRDDVDPLAFDPRDDNSPGVW